MKFEEALRQLEEIVGELEKGELSLDESLAKYEDGIKIYRMCLELLEGAEERLKMFTRDEKGRLLVKDLSQETSPGANNKG
ncbi:MAG: exodeoxyribonuclease VII small subunit [Candidatus Brocadiales bacterium]